MCICKKYVFRFRINMSILCIVYIHANAHLPKSARVLSFLTMWHVNTSSIQHKSSYSIRVQARHVGDSNNAKNALQHNDLRISISLERLPQSRVSYHRWSFSTKHHKDLSFIPQINTNMAKKRIGRKIVRIWIYGFIITGWWFQPLWKILVSWDYYSQYMEK